MLNKKVILVFFIILAIIVGMVNNDYEYIYIPLLLISVCAYSDYINGKVSIFLSCITIGSAIGYGINYNLIYEVSTAIVIFLALYILHWTVSKDKEPVIGGADVFAYPYFMIVFGVGSTIFSMIVIVLYGYITKIEKGGAITLIDKTFIILCATKLISKVLSSFLYM